MEKSKTAAKRHSTSTPQVDFVNVNFTVPYNLLSPFDKEAEMRGYTRSEALREAMRKQLELWTGRRW